MGFRWPHRWPIIAKDAFDPALMDHDEHGFSQLFIAEQDDRDRYLEDYLDTLPTGGGKRFATVVVAASNSLHHAATDADYVCTGVGDQSTIASAIAALPAAGGTVLLMEGTYNITAPINITTSNVNIVGVPGWASVIKTAAYVGAAIFNITAGSYYTFTDLQFSITGANTSILITAATCSVLRCVFTGGNQAVQVTSGSQTLIEHCFFYSLSTAVSVNSDAFVVANNFFQNNTTAITAPSGSSSSIVGNVIYTGVTGIHVGAPGNTRSITTISGNTTENVTGNSIELQAAIGVVVSNNSLYATSTAGQNGIQVSGGKDNTIVGNSVSSHGKANIYLTGNTVDNLVQSNTCRQETTNTSQYGVLIDAGSNTNVVVNNDLKGSGTVAAYSDAGTGTVKAMDGSVNNWNRLA